MRFDSFVVSTTLIVRLYVWPFVKILYIFDFSRNACILVDHFLASPIPSFSLLVLLCQSYLSVQACFVLCSLRRECFPSRDRSQHLLKIFSDMYLATKHVQHRREHQSFCTKEKNGDVFGPNKPASCPILFLSISTRKSTWSCGYILMLPM